MNDFLDINANLADPETRERIVQLTEHFTHELSMREAKKLAREIQTRLADAGSMPREVADFYHVMASRLLWTAFPVLTSENEQEELFAIAIAPALRDDNLIISTRIWAFLIEQDIPDRDALKKNWREALLRNTEVLTQPSFVTLQGETTRGTVQRWLRSFRAAATEGEWPTKIEQASYFVSDKNFHALTPLEQASVKELLSLYELLSRSSMTIEGVEEDITYIEDGVLKELNKETRRVEIVGATRRRPLPQRGMPDPTELLRAAARNGELAAFLAVEEAPLAVQGVLRRRLEQDQGMSQSAAAQLAVELANLSANAGKQEYFDMAYYDEATKTFRWKE